MSRKLYERVRGNYVGIFPPPGGWQAGRKGLRRTLCKTDEVDHLDEMDRTIRLTEMYSRKAREITDEQHKKEEERKKKQQRKHWTVNQAKELWLTSVKAGCEEKTVKMYKRSLELYISACGNHEMADYDFQKFDTYKVYLRDEANYRGRKLAKTTIHTHARHFKNFLIFCYDKAIIDKREKLKMPELPKKDMRTLQLKDINKIKRHIVTQISIYELEGDAKKATDYKNMMRAFMLATQMVARLGAIWSLTLKNVDLKSRMIYIRDNKELGWKNKFNKWPDKPVNDDLYDFLVKDLSERKPTERYYLDKGNGQPWYYDSGDISTMASDIFRELKLPAIKPFHWGMRATMITELLLDGEDPYCVQQLADHDSIETTMLYLNKRKVKQKKAADGIVRLMQKKELDRPEVSL